MNNYTIQEMADKVIEAEKAGMTEEEIYQMMRGMKNGKLQDHHE